MFSYVAYGLRIRSSLALPELVLRETEADVDIRLGRIDRLPSQAIAEKRCFRATPEEAHLFWKDVGAFLVRGGREIIVDPAPTVEEPVLRDFILGPALAVLLHQRGLLVLHASGVAAAGGAVLFLSESGWGKSTLAGALYSRGHNPVSDDMTAVHVDTSCARVFPGFPQLRLWPESAVALGYSLHTLSRLHPDLEKRACHVDRGFPPAPLPLRRIYVLAAGVTHEIDPLRPQEAFMELVRHSYCRRLLHAMGASPHFFLCTSLATHQTIRRLKIQRSLAALPRLARLVEEDLARDTSVG